MLVTIDNRIRIPLAELSEARLEQLQRAFTYENPEYEKAKRFSKYGPPKRIKRYLNSWTLEGGCLTLPRGGGDKVDDVLGFQEWQQTIRTTAGRHDLHGKIPDTRDELRDYQVALKNACIRAKTALINSPQGSGKTTTGFAIAADLKLPTLVVVPSERIMRQWIRGAESKLGLREDEIGIIQGATRRVRPLTIGMQQTLANCAMDYFDVFGVLICDEAQRFAASTFFGVVDVLPAEYRIGLTADERRADGMEFLVYDVFGPVVHEVPRERLIAEGAIIDSEVVIVPSDYHCEWYEKLPGHKRAEGKTQDKLAEHMSTDVGRNALIMEVLGWCHAEGKPTITMTRRREHCATLNALSLERGWDSGLMMGGAKSELEFDRTEQEMRDGVLTQAVGTYQAIGVGFDLPCVSRGIFATPCAGRDAEQQFNQFCGRFERPDQATGKTMPGAARIYYIWDRAIQGLSAVKNIARWKPRVFVLEGGAQVPVRQWLKGQEAKDGESTRRQDEQLGFRTIR